MISFMLLGSSQAFATHTAGMDMFYRHTQDSSYEFTVIFYRNCQGFTATAPFSANVRYYSPSLGFTATNLTFLCSRLPTTGTGVPPLEPPNMYNCTGAINALCYEEYVYRGTWSSRGRATDWRFSWQWCCRPGPPPFQNAPTNIAYAQQYIECGLNNLDFPDTKAKNWSPIWHNRRPNHPGYTTDTIVNYLFRTLCMGNFYSLDMTVREYQGDSVTYGFYWPQGVNGTNIPYINGWSFTSPMPTLNGPLTIGTTTGIIPIVPGAPTGTGIYVLGLEAKEWRYDTIVSGGTFVRIAKQIGYIRRDMTLWIDDTTTCRRDSVKPKDITISNGGGDTIVSIFFHTGNTGDPNSLVRCETLSPDGSEFRIVDSSRFIAPFDSTVYSIGVHKATWNCNAGLTEKVTLYLDEPLRCQDYYVFLKKGTDLDVIESECGFVEPEFSSGRLTVSKDVQVGIDTGLNILSFCLPMDEEYPKLTASSNDSASFPLDYFWAYNPDPNDPGIGDTVEGQEVPFTWATQTGKYTVLVRDPYDCPGDDDIKVYYDTKPSFFFDVPAYCDKYGELPTMPDSLIAPSDSTITEWEWHEIPLGFKEKGDVLHFPTQDTWHKLIGFKDRIAPGTDKCFYEYEFFYGRDSFPPQAPLYVRFNDDYHELCLTFGDTANLTVWEEGIRDKYAPIEVQWYYQGLPMPGNNPKWTTTDTGYYSVRLTDSLGCWGEDTTYVGFDVQLPGPDVNCTVDRNGGGTFTYTWPEEFQDFIVGYEYSVDDGITWEPTTAGSSHYIINVENQPAILARGLVNGACYATEDSLSHECPDEVFPPNVITPNGDGLNDVFEVGGLNLYRNSQIEIFDRWGNRVYESNDYTNDWDGDDLPEGTYYFVLKVDDPNQTVHKGVITLLR